MPAYEHLRIEREQPVNQRRSRTAFGGKPPEDIVAHGQRLYESFTAAKETTQQDIGGFDDRCLFKLQMQGLAADMLEKIPGVELVSEEDGGYALAFANQQALAEFEARLTKLSIGEFPTRKEIFFALQGFDHWKAEDRTGWALKRDGLPLSEEFILDVELWPLSRSNERNRLLAAFNVWLIQQGITTLDSVNLESLILFRIRTNKIQTEQLLHHRDIRIVDLPPKFGLEPQLFACDIQDIGDVSAPPEGTPIVSVLDSGIVAGHPLIGPALGDAQGFINPNRSEHDDNGHGTRVAGIALYGDIEECARSKSFIPQLRLVSGKILDENAEGDPRLIENIIDEAVRYFHDAYGCRIFNISFGDQNKPYLGGHLKGLAYTLDQLSRELNILFVVPTGNFLGVDGFPTDWKNDYPDYLFSEHARLLDPAPALNVLTVGSVARWDQSYYAQRHTNDPREVPIAQREQPSPFTRCGESVRAAIKPDIAAYGGNYAINQYTRYRSARLLGELSLNKDFSTGGSLFAEDIGTSYSAPQATHYAGRLLIEIPDASASLLRALLIAHTEVPQATRILFDGDDDKICQSVGYGMIKHDTLYRSIEEDVTLIAEEQIINNHHHFYEIPVPDSFYQSGRRQREITISLAYCPTVRTTRIDYKASKIEFRLVEAAALDEIVATFNVATSRDNFPSIPELNVKHTHSLTQRSKGTVQGSTWIIKQPRTKKLFLVVTRKDPMWGDGLTRAEEPYAVVMRLSDRENEHARLYSEIRVQLQARERARQRIRRP
jgi:hypothetical protein